MPETNLLELVNVIKRYDSPDRARPRGGRRSAPGREDPGTGTLVLNGVCLQVREGQALAVVGPSGSGKSTLLNIIGALDRPTAGQVLLDGQDLSALDEPRLARIRNRQIGFVFQLHHLLPQCTALENVLVPTLVSGRTDAQLEARARKLLERVGLGERMAYRPGHLSGGECQRVAVVRALINRPRLLLADEPTGSLDRLSAADLAELLLGLNRDENVAMIVVTHSEELAGRIGNVLELRDGKLAPREGTQ